MKLLSGRSLAVLFSGSDPQLLATLRCLGFIAFELLIQKLSLAPIESCEEYAAQGEYHHIRNVPDQPCAG